MPEGFAGHLERVANGLLLELAQNRLEKPKRPGTSAAIAPPPGRVIRDCLGCPEMVVVPAGGFMMGSPRSEEGRYSEEGPQHRVNVAAFAVGKYEVTKAEFAAFVDDTGYVASAGCWTYTEDDWRQDSSKGWRDPGFAQTGLDPVTRMNWDDAKGYVAWLSLAIGQTYRLPSEAEWEYAARAGTRTRYWWGDGISSKRANYARNEDRTAAVGSYAANAFGLYDVHGNVWEWVEDCYHDSYRGAPLNGRAWRVGGDCAQRVVRGGSWFDVPGGARAAARTWVDPAARVNNVGFRVAKTLRP